MCGRYTVYTEEENIELRAILDEVNRRCREAGQAPAATGEIFPTHTAPVLAAEGGVRTARPMRWGFPKWQGPGVIINARGETAAQKPTFRGPLASRRCIVPTTGFLEWRHEGGRTKEKYLFRLPGERMLYLAGLWNRFSPPGEPPYNGFVILTTAANASVRGYHDRMPLILLPGQTDPWLYDPAMAQEFVLAPCEAELTALSA